MIQKHRFLLFLCAETLMKGGERLLGHEHLFEWIQYNRLQKMSWWSLLATKNKIPGASWLLKKAAGYQTKFPGTSSAPEKKLLATKTKNPGASWLIFFFPVEPCNPVNCTYLAHVCKSLYTGSHLLAEIKFSWPRIQKKFSLLTSSCRFNDAISLSNFTISEFVGGRLCVSWRTTTNIAGGVN